ncbi:uncharacterized protein LOC128709790 [Anopheles marshallii]|uniref:uncharacterized protein LOC128709790 n=1 Tax=Anopheles marshallii TaxID=1521116 RepID=UPI00237AFE91|nr:uncharacterized protein LOC128709790 [Anopheles marshallii]
MTLTMRYYHHHHFHRYLPVVALITLCSVVVSAYVYKCEPGTEPTVCRIWNLHYDEEAAAKHPDRVPTANFSSTVRTVHLLYFRYYFKRHNQLRQYDLTLHGTVLRNPPNVLIHETRLERLFIPTNLQMGDFTDNIITVIVTDPSQTYDVRYLDLADNRLSNVANLSALTRLETLNLEANRLRTLDPDMFKRMDNLTHLYLGDNHFASFDFKTFPKRLQVLWLTRNSLSKLNLAGFILAELKELDLESNSLTTLNLASVFTAFPALQTLPIAYNKFGKSEAKLMLAELRRRNVSYFIGMERDDDLDCDYDEFRVDDLCFTEVSIGDNSFWKGTVLLVVAVLVVAVFLLSVRWIWYQMRY